MQILMQHNLNFDTFTVYIYAKIFSFTISREYCIIPIFIFSTHTEYIITSFRNIIKLTQPTTYIIIRKRNPN